MRLAALISHPIQYYAPIFRAIAARCELHVFFGQSLNPAQQAASGFDTPFEWDVDLLSGYESSFLQNVSKRPGPDHFLGCDTPEIGERLREGGFDALLVMGWYLKTHAQGIFAAKRQRLPVMVRGDSHLGTPRSWLKRAGKSALFPPLLRVFDAALVVGEHNRDYWNHYRYPRTRMFASPHCVDTEWFATSATSQARHDLRRSLGIAPEAPVALFAGKLVDFKRPADLIVAAAGVRRKSVAVEVLIAGSGPLEPDLRALAASSDVPLHMLGFCNQSQMPAAYAAADALVLPSTRETWGLVANEALACGKPVVLSDAVGCAADFVRYGRAARIFPVGDVAGCAEALCETLICPPPANVIARINLEFSIEAAVAGIIQASKSISTSCRQ